VGRARNIGAEQATGEIYVFSDADTRLEPGGLKKIADLSDYNTIGIPLGKGDDGGIKGKIFFFYKNFGHKLGFYKGAIFGILFCHKDIFLKTNGFDPVRRIAEYSDFIKRAIKAGGDYKLLKDCCAITSLRRFERNGYTKEYLFWIKWRLLSLVNKSENLEKEYFNK